MKESMTPATRRVLLANGGYLVVTVTVDLFDLKDKDQEFVFGLIDRINVYEKVIAQRSDAGSHPGESTTTIQDDR